MWRPRIRGVPFWEAAAISSTRCGDGKTKEFYAALFRSEIPPSPGLYRPSIGLCETRFWPPSLKHAIQRHRNRSTRTYLLILLAVSVLIRSERPSTRSKSRNAKQHLSALGVAPS
ncbi:hypothetical protein XA68_10583 [Ophiocordyceps unilateralis]|uniref:Uncharacterized protein n=1 Tax=Ophiocordyceps unilateralis TaxID=268505 RepID=A0A2A9P2Q4_OPHUN|nr:hypothetical protein XA68_10583 [Ophiocordyceps unilateralis]